VASVNSLPKTVSDSILPERIIAILSACFGALALLITAIGRFGLMAYNVTQRVRDEYGSNGCAALPVTHRPRRRMKEATEWPLINKGLRLPSQE
jgi:hypothetical protein